MTASMQYDEDGEGDGDGDGEEPVERSASVLEGKKTMSANCPR